MKHFIVRSILAVCAIAVSVGATYSYVPEAQAEQPLESHQAKGIVASVEPENGRVKISHGKVPSLNWPPMSMYFQVKSGEILDQLKQGAEVHFTFEEKGKGQYVVTDVTTQ